LGTGGAGELEIDELHSMGGQTAAGLVVVLIAVVALGLMPAVVALGVAPVTAGWLVAGFGGLAAVVGGAKVVVVIWAAMGRPSTSRGALSASPSID
jgi:hypothetical protein